MGRDSKKLQNPCGLCNVISGAIAMVVIKPIFVSCQFNLKFPQSHCIIAIWHSRGCRGICGLVEGFASYLTTHLRSDDIPQHTPYLAILHNWLLPTSSASPYTNKLPADFKHHLPCHMSVCFRKKRNNKPHP